MKHTRWEGESDYFWAVENNISISCGKLIDRVGEKKIITVETAYIKTAEG